MNDDFFVLPLCGVAYFLFTLGVFTSWWVPLAVIGAIVVGAIIYVVYLFYKNCRTELAQRREALIKRADEQHLSLMNGAIENDVEAMDLGFYGEYPPERIAA